MLEFLVTCATWTDMLAARVVRATSGIRSRRKRAEHELPSRSLAGIPGLKSQAAPQTRH